MDKQRTTLLTRSSFPPTTFPQPDRLVPAVPRTEEGKEGKRGEEKAVRKKKAFTIWPPSMTAIMVTSPIIRLRRSGGKERKGKKAR